MNSAITFMGKVWRWSLGKGSWYFITLPPNDSSFIKWTQEKRVTYFGSIRVEARIGESSWKTSIFPSKEYGGYILPIKAEIRKKELLKEDSEVSITLTLV